MVNQVEFHVGMGPGAQRYAPELVQYLKSQGVVPMAYSPLGPTFNSSEKAELIEGNLTTGIGRRHGKSGAQVALRWVIQSGLALATRSSNPAYLAEDSPAPYPSGSTTARRIPRRPNPEARDGFLPLWSGCAAPPAPQPRRLPP